MINSIRLQKTREIAGRIMNQITQTKINARIAYKAVNGDLSMVDLSGYSRSSKAVFKREFRKCRFPFLRTVNEIR